MKWRFLPLIAGVAGLGLLVASRRGDEPSACPPVLHRSSISMVEARSDTAQAAHADQAVPNSGKKSRSSASAKNKTTRAMDLYRAVVAQDTDDRMLGRLESALRNRKAGLQEWEMALWGLNRLGTRPCIGILTRFLDGDEPLARRIRVVETLGGCEEPAAGEALYSWASRGPGDPLAVAAYQALSRRGKWDPTARKQAEQLRTSVLWSEFALQHPRSQSKK